MRSRGCRRWRGPPQATPPTAARTPPLRGSRPERSLHRPPKRKWGPGHEITQSPIATAAILEASTQVEVWDEEVDFNLDSLTYHTAAPVLPADAESPGDYLERVAMESRIFRSDERLIAGIGGEHSVTFPLVQAAVDSDDFSDITIVQIDAPALTVQKAVLGSVRVLRDYMHTRQLPAELRFTRSLGPPLRWSHLSPGGKTRYELVLEPLGGARARSKPDGAVELAAADAERSMRWRLTALGSSAS